MYLTIPLQREDRVLVYYFEVSLITICYGVWFQNFQVNGDSVFVDGDFKVFKCGESSNWDQQYALSNTAV